MNTLRDVMTPSPVTVDISDSVITAAQMMRDEDIGSVPVMDEQMLVGIITDRDITVKVVAEGIDPKTAQVGEYASTHLVTGRPDMPIEKAIDLMAREQIRRLPILDQSRLVGIVSLGDLAVESHADEEVEDALEEISQPAR
jgi:CBS domain-containing protein